MQPAITLASIMASRRFRRLILCIRLLMAGNLSVVCVKDPPFTNKINTTIEIHDHVILRISVFQNNKKKNSEK